MCECEFVCIFRLYLPSAHNAVLNMCKHGRAGRNGCNECATWNDCITTMLEHFFFFFQYLFSCWIRKTILNGRLQGLRKSARAHKFQIRFFFLFKFQWMHVCVSNPSCYMHVYIQYLLCQYFSSRCLHSTWIFGFWRSPTTEIIRTEESAYAPVNLTYVTVSALVMCEFVWFYSKSKRFSGRKKNCTMSETERNRPREKYR